MSVFFPQGGYSDSHQFVQIPGVLGDKTGVLTAKQPMHLLLVSVTLLRIPFYLFIHRLKTISSAHIGIFLAIFHSQLIRHLHMCKLALLTDAFLHESFNNNKK